MGEDTLKMIKALVGFVIVAAIFIIPVVGYRTHAVVSAEVAEVELQVVDKDVVQSVIYAGVAPVTTRSYKLIVDFGGQRQRVTTSASVYNNIEIGDSAIFKVYYNSKGKLMSISL